MTKQSKSKSFREFTTAGGFPPNGLTDETDETNQAMVDIASKAFELGYDFMQDIARDGRMELAKADSNIALQAHQAAFYAGVVSYLGDRDADKDLWTPDLTKKGG